jgi:hypothetical protein
MKTVTDPKKAKQVRQKRVFEDIEWINDAYSEAKFTLDKLIKDWNPKNPGREIKANALYVTAYLHYCIPNALNPNDLFSNTKKPQRRLVKIIEDLDQSKFSKNKYINTITDANNIDKFFRRLIADRIDNPKEIPYVIPGSNAEFKDLYNCVMIKSGDKIILRARSKDHECYVNALGKVELKEGGKVKTFPSVSEAGIKGLKYPGYSQWDSAYLIGGFGKRIPLRELKDRFERERPFPAHFDSPTQPKQKSAPQLVFVEETDKDEEFYEGSIRRISVEVRERDAAARKACIAKHGAKCFICEFDFGQFYGPEADGFIHVHHREKLASRKGASKTDPVKDLVPLCPNCHSVVHLRKDTYGVEEVKVMVERQKLMNNKIPKI